MREELHALMGPMAWHVHGKPRESPVEDGGAEHLRIDLVILDAGGLHPGGRLAGIEGDERDVLETLQGTSEEMPPIGSFAGHYLVAGEAAEDGEQFSVGETRTLEDGLIGAPAIDHADRRRLGVEIEADDVRGSIGCCLQRRRAGEVLLEDGRGHTGRGKGCPSVYGCDHGHFSLFILFGYDLTKACCCQKRLSRVSPKLFAL